MIIFFIWHPLWGYAMNVLFLLEKVKVFLRGVFAMDVPLWRRQWLKK